jgi:hypothetical protein
MVFGKGEVRAFQRKNETWSGKNAFWSAKNAVWSGKKKHKCVHISDKHAIVGKLLAAKNKCILDEKQFSLKKQKMHLFEDAGIYQYNIYISM